MILVGHALDDPQLVALIADATAGPTLVGIVEGVRRRQAADVAAGRAMVARRMARAGR